MNTTKLPSERAAEEIIEGYNTALDNQCCCGSIQAEHGCDYCFAMEKMERDVAAIIARETGCDQLTANLKEAVGALKGMVNALDSGLIAYNTSPEHWEFKAKANAVLAKLSTPPTT